VSYGIRLIMQQFNCGILCFKNREIVIFIMPVGSIGCVWFIFWMFLCYDSPARHPRISSDEREYIESRIGEQKVHVTVTIIFAHKLYTQEFVKSLNRKCKEWMVAPVACDCNEILSVVTVD